MAKVAKMPSRAIISGFKGKVDFYVYMGLACARKWPRSPGHKRAPAVQEHWLAFAWACQNWNSLTPSIQQAFRNMAAGSNMTGRDIFIKSYLSHDHFHIP